MPATASASTAYVQAITDTPMLRKHVRHAADPEAHLHQRMQRVQSGAMLYPDDTGKAVTFLCSDFNAVDAAKLRLPAVG